MKNHIASVSAKRSRAPKRGAVRHMRIAAADNGGFVAETSHHSADGENEYRESLEEKTVHPSISHLVKHIKAKFGAAHEAAETPEKEAKEEAAAGEEG